MFSAKNIIRNKISNLARQARHQFEVVLCHPTLIFDPEEVFLVVLANDLLHHKPAYLVGCGVGEDRHFCAFEARNVVVNYNFLPPPLNEQLASEKTNSVQIVLDREHLHQHSWVVAQCLQTHNQLQVRQLLKHQLSRQNPIHKQVVFHLLQVIVVRYSYKLDRRQLRLLHRKAVFRRGKECIDELIATYPALVYLSSICVFKNIRI